jgi:hypothetical protein
MTLGEIIAQFKEKEELLHKHDTNSLEIVIEQARLMVQLRVKARKNWEDTCKKKLNLDPRVARRYLKVGEKWSDQNRTPGSDLLATLPSDLHKLEALCQLTVDQLKTLSGQIDLRKVERAEVIAKVKALVGKGGEEKPDSSPVLAVLNRWDAFATRVVKDVKNLDQAGRQEFAEELDDLVQRLQEGVHDALQVPGPEGVAAAEGDQPEGDGADHQADGEEESEPADAPEELAQPPKAGRPVVGRQVGRQRAKPQPA